MSTEKNIYLIPEPQTKQKYIKIGAFSENMPVYKYINTAIIIIKQS
jgi:hypothetical protein